MSHALLSPSSASRWLSCTPSARLEAGYPDKSSSYADEGTLAHRLGELLIREKLGEITKVEYKKAFEKIQIIEIGGIKQDNPLYDDAMLEYADDYASFVMEQFNEARAHTSDAEIFLEQRLNMTDYVPEGFGTGDVVIIANHTLSLIDLKYGKGVPVNVEENKQMMLYALGALREFDYLYDIVDVRVTIYQPRIGNISTWIISVVELKEWAETILKPLAQKAYNGEGEFVPGNHCQFCKAKGVCKALADYNLQLAKYDFMDEVLLSDEEIADILTRAKLFQNWITAVETHALTEAVNNGKKWPGYKVVEGRSNRKYTDADAVASKLQAEGVKEDIIYVKKVIGITALEKELGKSKFNDLLNGLIVKPPGKPALVPENDKRPELNSNEAAKLDFAELAEIDN